MLKKAREYCYDITEDRDGVLEEREERRSEKGKNNEGWRGSSDMSKCDSLGAAVLVFFPFS